MRICIALMALPLMAAAPAGGDSRTVREPAFGLPHFYGDTDLELARENGYEIARDRLTQLILLARVGRGTLSQAFGLLSSGFVEDDVEARRLGYTSSELNLMFENLPQRERDLVFAYCEGVSDAIEQIYAGALPQPFEVSILRSPIFGLSADLFGNATNISDQIDPYYAAPGDADPERPLAGFQFTPEMAIAIGILEVRNFGLGGFDEASRFDELQSLVAAHGETAGTQIWSDLNFANDPLAPVSVPDPTTPGFGGPLAASPESVEQSLARLARLASRFPRHAYADAMDALAARQAARAERARELGAWPALGSYAWAISGQRSSSGWPWIGGFPQTGIQTPSIMHFAENRSGEGTHAVGMEFVGAPLILIGHTDRVAYTTTTAQLPVVDTFFEVIVRENADALRYDDEGTPSALSMRTERILTPAEISRVFWRSHERQGNGGSRSIAEFLGDCEGTASGGDATTLVDDGGNFTSCLTLPGHVAIVAGTGAGQIRAVTSMNDTTLVVMSPWSTPPDASSQYVAASVANDLIAVAFDSAAWLEESTAVLGFAQYQRADSIADVRAGARIIPTTHNFFAADNRDWNGQGTQSGNGNIGYWSSGFSRKRAGMEDPRLPLDGRLANPLVVASGSVEIASDLGIVAKGAFEGRDFSPPPLNFRYENPTLTGGEYIVTISAGPGSKQTRRIASNDANSLIVESAWGVVPAAGARFEVYEIIAMPEAVNPSEGFTANWNNKAATADPGDDFGRQHRVIFIGERLAANASVDRLDQRQLNADVAGLDGKGAFGRYLIPRLREAWEATKDGVGPVVAPQVEAMLSQLETHHAEPSLGRRFVDPVHDTSDAGEVAFLGTLVGRLVTDIYDDELAAAGELPGSSSRRLAMVQHAIDSAAGDLPGSYAQAYAGDYFNGAGWESVVGDSLVALSSPGIPAPGVRPLRTYVHPLAGIPGLDEILSFPPTLAGNRGTWEQIVEVGPVIKGEFVFPLGQSGLITGSAPDLTVDPHFESLHPVWRDWRFVPMLSVSADLAAGGDGDEDDDGILDGFERWHFGDTSRGADDDGDADELALIDEYLTGADPTDSDTDNDQVLDGADFAPQDRLVTVPEPAAVLLHAGALAALLAVARIRAHA